MMRNKKRQKSVYIRETVPYVYSTVNIFPVLGGTDVREARERTLERSRQEAAKKAKKERRMLLRSVAQSVVQKHKRLGWRALQSR
jgi:hypothetical protein